jgi:hypothetical protein
VLKRLGRIWSVGHTGRCERRTKFFVKRLTNLKTSKDNITKNKSHGNRATDCGIDWSSSE